MDRPNRCDVTREATPIAVASWTVSTRSASTAPASTEASWSGSPTRIRRVPGPHRLQQASHHRQRHHRRLVDHHHVVGQPVVAMVPEPRRGVGAGAEQPVQRDRADPGQPSLIGGRQLGDFVLDRLLEPGGGLAGRCGERDPDGRPPASSACSASSASSAATVVVLPVPGSAGQHGRGPGQGDAGGRALLVVAGRREDAVESRRQPGLVGCRGRRGRSTRSAVTCSSSRQ